MSRLIERSLDVELFDCDVSTCTFPFTTGWRTAPFLVNAHGTGVDSRIDFIDRPSMAMRDGDACCIGAGIRHCITILHPGSGISRWSHIQFTVFASLDLLTVVAPPVILKGRAAIRIGDINTRLTALKQDQRIQAVVQRRILLFEFLSTLLEAGAGMSQDRGLERLRQVQRVAPALGLIDSRLQDPELTVLDLADACQLSASRFRSVFKSAIGSPPQDVLQSRRMRRAEQLLLSSDDKVKAVAALSGWADEFHFSRIFKQLHGMSPRSYREQGRESGL